VGGDAARALGPGDPGRLVVFDVDARAIDFERAAHQGDVPGEHGRAGGEIDLELVGSELDRVAGCEWIGSRELARDEHRRRDEKPQYRLTPAHESTLPPRGRRSEPEGTRPREL